MLFSWLHMESTQKLDFSLALEMEWPSSESPMVMSSTLTIKQNRRMDTELTGLLCYGPFSHTVNDWLCKCFPHEQEAFTCIPLLGDAGGKVGTLHPFADHHKTEHSLRWTGEWAVNNCIR